MKVECQVNEMILVNTDGIDHDSLLVCVRWQDTARGPWQKKNVVVTGTNVPAVLKAAAAAISDSIAQDPTTKQPA